MRRKRHLRKRELKKKNRKIIMTSLIILSLLTVGYGAFQTTLNVSVTGKIKVTDESCFSFTDNGDGTATLTDYDISCGTTVRIPNTINGLTITRIADVPGGTTIGPFVKKAVTKVILPKYLEYIGDYAFSLSSIKKIKFPTTMRVVGQQAFNMTPLKEIELNEGLETIRPEAFTRTNLTSIRIPSTVKNTSSAIATANLMKGTEAFIYAKDENGLTDYTTLNSYGDREATEIEIPSNIKKIGQLCFYFTNNLTTLNIPDTVEELDRRFVYNMQNLETINIGSGIKIINNQALIGLVTTLKHVTVNINRAENSIPGAPWGATNATINWVGTE